MCQETAFPTESHLPSPQPLPPANWASREAPGCSPQPPLSFTTRPAWGDQAANKQVMLYWLQQLQMKRWEFHNSLPAPPVVPDAALAGNESALRLELEQEEAELEEFLHPVKTPPGLVGMAAALQPAPAMPLALQNISLKHLGTEIQNTMYNIRGNRQAQGTGHGPPGEDPLPSSEPPREERPSSPDPSAPGKDPGETLKPAPKSSLTANLIQKAKRQNNTFPFFAEGLTRNRTAQERALVLEQQVLMLTKELKSQKELVRILHKALEAAQQEKRATSAYLAAAEDKDRLELVRHKVRQIAELSRRVEALEQERESLAQAASLHEQQVQELQQHVQLLMDKNQAKQQVICKLSEKVTQDFIQPPNPLLVPPDAANRDFLSQQEKMEHLKDDMEAYQTQNRFLNSEIHQVTKIWRKVAEKERTLLMKCAYLQAKNCQVESKYLAGLRRLQEAMGNQGSECAELLRQLIQEALQWEASEASADNVELSPISEYDEYGFQTVPSYEVEDLKLLAKIQALEVHSHHLLAHEAMERPLRERWAALGELAPSVELKQLLRMGVSREHRPRVWRWLIHRRVQHLQAPGRYQELLSRSQTCKHPAARQIELDLNRTFTNNKHFTCPTSSFPDKLRRVLLAFSWQNPSIGYCQGLNRLAAIALLVLGEEESAFWCLVAIVETIMPADYYSKTLTASQVDQRVLQDLLSEKLPRLMAHLGQLRVDLSFITFNWFLVVFADSLISNILFQVWDAFLYEGTKPIQGLPPWCVCSPSGDNLPWPPIPFLSPHLAPGGVPLCPGHFQVHRGGDPEVTGQPRDLPVPALLHQDHFQQPEADEHRLQRHEPLSYETAAAVASGPPGAAGGGAAGAGAVQGRVLGDSGSPGPGGARGLHQ
ncbi:TBC1 domain family member 2A isoform X5 [Myotis myotis]|uniref:TBC1 domain family member 2A isoform X5 n=1 Tax=Myotis myotis TaxID=51298 RepID=UPI0017483932|nr:TBC1 domain family member 2A isoform X5 [Myotis myotis]